MKRRIRDVFLISRIRAETPSQELFIYMKSSCEGVSARIREIRNTSRILLFITLLPLQPTPERI